MCKTIEALEIDMSASTVQKIEQMHRNGVSAHDIHQLLSYDDLLGRSIFDNGDPEQQELYRLMAQKGYEAIAADYEVHGSFDNEGANSS